METIWIFATIGVAILSLVTGYLIAYFLLKKTVETELAGIISGERQDAIKRSRSVLGGLFSEQIAPYLPGFPYSPTECKFLGKPVDFVVFKGADQNEIKEVVFLEIKSGNSQLSKQEKNLKETILQKKVKWDEYRVENNDKKIN